MNKKKKQKIKLILENMTFDTFAQLNPVKAYHYDKTMFCEYMRSNGYDLTNHQIGKLIKAVETPIK